MRQRIMSMGWGDRPGTGTGDHGGDDGSPAFASSCPSPQTPGPSSSSFRRPRAGAGCLSDRFVRYAEERGLSMRPKMAFSPGPAADKDRVVHGKADVRDARNCVRQQYHEEEDDNEDGNNPHANPQEDGAPDGELRHDSDDGEEGGTTTGREEAKVPKRDEASIVPQDARLKYGGHPLPRQRALRQAGMVERFDLDPDADLDLDPSLDLDAALDLDLDLTFHPGEDGVGLPSPMNARFDADDSSATFGDECDDGGGRATPGPSAPSFFDLVERAQEEITRRRVATRLRRVLELSSSAAADVRRRAADRRRRLGRHRRPGLICSLSSVLSRDDDDEDDCEDSNDDDEEGLSDCEYGEEEEVTFSPTGFSEVVRGEESGVQEAEDMARQMEREVEWWRRFESGSGTSLRDGCG